MSLVKKNAARQQHKSWLPTTLILALWQVRRTWGLLLIVGLGMLACIILICAAPLYTTVAATAGLRNTLNASAQNSSIFVSGQSSRPRLNNITPITQDINNHTHGTISPYLSSTQLSLQTQLLPLMAQSKPDAPFRTTPDLLQMVSYPMNQSAQHLTLLRGRLPSDTPQSNIVDAQGNGSLEIALTAESAQALKVDVGSSIQTDIATVYEPILRKDHLITLHVVGIFSLPATDDYYWNDTSFTSYIQDPNVAIQKKIYIPLASSNAFSALLTQFWPSDVATPGDATALTTLEEPINFYWYYRLDAARVTTNDLDAILNGFSNFQVANSNDTRLSQPEIIDKTQTITPTDALTQYRNEISVATVPVTGFELIIFGLILYFVALMADFLVERQANALALLRSRGASRGQVFGALVLQSSGAGLVALIAGPLIAISVVQFIGQKLLPASNLNALNVVTQDPISAALSVKWYAIIALVVILLAMLVAINHTTAHDVLAMRREASRTTQRPLWLRLNLDIIAAIIMIVGYIVSSYLTNSDILTPQLRLILLSPLVLGRTIFSVLAAILLFLRIFPYLLHAGAWLAMRSRGATSMVALAQMSRAPRQSLRLTLLLSLATAFAIFAVIFYSSQLQRTSDVAAYQVGADFSGQLPVGLDVTQLQSTTNLYSHIAGVRSATLSYSTSDLKAGSNLDQPFNLLAVDANTFAQTAIWPANNAKQPLPVLMQQLKSQREQAIKSSLIPVWIDAALWDTLHLAPGETFIVSDSNSLNTQFHFKALGMIQNIPTVNTPGAMLTDAQTYMTVYQQIVNSTSLDFNQVLLRTNDDTTSLARVQSTIQNGEAALTQIKNRRELIQSLQHEPLYLDLIGILALGPITVLLLALVGNLLATWLNAHDRLRSFALLRAIGAAPGHIASTLTWEQVIIYTTGMILGVIFGAFVSATVIPSLLFTSATSADANSNQFFLAQNIPPVQIIIPALLGIAMAILIGVCMLALGMMIRVVSKPGIAQTLRLNED